MRRGAAVCLLAWAPGMVSSALADVPPPPIAARAWLLLDVTSNQVLAEQNQQAKMEPASLTKLMTAYLTFAALKEGRIGLTQQVLPSSLIQKVRGDESRQFLEPNKPVLVEELLQGLIIQSGNDSALALAELVGGSEPGFVTLMNREAERLGMKQTHFTNPAGIPDAEHYTTAADLGILASHLVRDFPEYYHYYSQRDYTYNGIRQPNRNRLLVLDPTVDGMKTGHTSSAGYCLISTAKRALTVLPSAAGKPVDVPGERRVLSVVMGTASEAIRVEESLKLLNYGFQHFDTVKLYDKNQTLVTPEIWKGKADTLKLGMSQATYMTVPRGVAGRLKPVLERQETIVAPIALGQVLGQVKMMDGSKVIAQFPVVALEAIEEAGFFGRLWDSLRLWLRSL